MFLSEEKTEDELDLENFSRVRFPGRLQNKSMLPFHATNRKKACISHGLPAGANKKKLALDFLVNFFYATPTVYLFLQLFYSFYTSSDSP